MHGIIFDIKRFAIHDGAGIRTTVFFKGCPLSCWWCHNPESRNTGIEQMNTVKHGAERTETVGRQVTVPEVLAELERDRLFYEESGGGITLSGGEPLQQPDFLAALLEACRNAGFHTVVDTSGYGETAVIDRISNLVDLFLFDLKLMNPSEHQVHTGIDNKSILENLKRLIERGAAVQVRIPLVPGITDTNTNLEAAVEFLYTYRQAVGVSLLPFNILARNKFYKFCIENRVNRLETQSVEQIDGMKALFTRRGLTVELEGQAR